MSMAMTPQDDGIPDYSGRVLPAGNDTVTGWLVDRLGCRILFEGRRDRAGGGYLLKSTGIEIPGWLQMADEKRAEDAA